MKRTYSKTRKNFAKAFAIILAIITIITICSTSTNATTEVVYNYYPETGMITQIEYSDSGCLMEITVANGNQFSYYSEGNADYFKYDFVSMIMDSKRTELVYDDEILMCQYSGVLEHFTEYITEE